MVTHRIVANDERPEWPIVLGFAKPEGSTLTDEQWRAQWPAFPNGTTVRCVTVKRGTPASVKISPATGPGSVAIDDAAARRVIKSFAQGEFTNADADAARRGPASHDVQWHITYSDGTSETWPPPGQYDELVVGYDLDAGAVT